MKLKLEKTERTKTLQAPLSRDDLVQNLSLMNKSLSQAQAEESPSLHLLYGF